jgi:arylsulfatase A-like enzyme
MMIQKNWRICLSLCLTLYAGVIIPPVPAQTAQKPAYNVLFIAVDDLRPELGIFGTRVPLMIVMPGAKGNGKVSPRVVEAVDLYPTLADLCGLPAPQGLAGQSLKPLLDNPQAKWDQPAYTVTKFGANIGKAVRTERWRYAEYDDGGAMLFDRRTDPHELKNLANDPAYAKTVAEMKKLLSQMPN